MGRIYHGGAHEPEGERSTVAEVLELNLRAAVGRVDKALRTMPDPRVRDDLLDIRNLCAAPLKLLEEGRALRDVVEAEAVGRR